MSANFEATLVSDSTWLVIETMTTTSEAIETGRTYVTLEADATDPGNTPAAAIASYRADIDGAPVVATAASAAELLAYERRNMECTPLQGQLAIGEAMWAQVEAYLDAPGTPWAMRRTVEAATVWKRTDETMDGLIWIMGLTAEQADDLFRLAVTINP